MTDSGVGGQLHGISLDSFLQMAQMEKTTCTLSVKKGGNLGFMYLLKGQLIDAETGDMSGKEAACEIVSWINAVIEIENTCSKKKNNINEPLMEILTEGMKTRDEKMAPRKAKAGKPKKAVPTAGAKKAAPKATDGKAKPSGKTAPKSPAAGPKPRRKGKPKTEPVSTPVKKGFPVKLVAIGAVALIVIAGVIFALFFMDSGKTAYENMLTQVENETNPAGQINLLKKFVGGREPDEYTRKAEEKLKEIQASIEEQAFDDVIINVGKLPFDDHYQKAATDLYNQYLAKYPESRFAGEAKQKISGIPELLDEEDYEKLKGAETLSLNEKIPVYKRYLEKHPDGKHRKAVRQMLSDMGESYYRNLKQELSVCEKDKEWGKCIALCSSFIETFKDNTHLEEIVALKINFQGKNILAELMDAAAQKGSDYGAAREVYIAYLGKHPNSIHKGPVTAELERVDAKIASRDQWARIVADSKESKKDISDRINWLKAYMLQNPSSPFEEDAKKLMAELIAEKKAMARQKLKASKEKRRLARIKLGEETRQRQKAIRRKLEQSVIGQLQKSGGRYHSNGDGTVADSTTGLTWTLLDSQLDLSKCLTYSSAKNYVQGLKTGGLRDWRLPTAGELAGIYKNPPFFPSSGAGWYWSSETYVKGYHRIANIVTAKQETIFNIKQERQDRCGAVRAVRP